MLYSLLTDYSAGIRNLISWSTVAIAVLIVVATTRLETDGSSAGAPAFERATG